MNMPDGARRREPGSLVPEQWRKQPAAPKAERAPQTREEVSARWDALMQKKGQGDLTPDEAREAEMLEAQMRRMRQYGEGVDKAA